MTIANTNTEYRDLPLSFLIESKTNPRRFFEDSALNELAASIRSQGVLSPLLVRPLTDRSFEIVAGARRYRAAHLASSITRRSNSDATKGTLPRAESEVTAQHGSAFVVFAARS